MPVQIASDVKSLTFDDWTGLHHRQREARIAMTTRKKPLILMGGSGFGGKSYGLRALAIYWHFWLFKHGFHGMATIFASSSYEALRDRHFKYFMEEYGHLGEIALNDKVFGRCFRFYDKRFGAICFRNLQDPGEKRGSEYAGGFLDETTEILRPVFGDFAYMVRSSKGLPHMPVVTASNPDGIGHAWCKAVWRPTLSGDHRLEPYDTLTDPTGKMDPADYIYVPFLPDDNPAFVEEEFWAQVAHLPEHVQMARRYGRWDSPEGARWGFLDPAKHTYRMKDAFPQGIPEHWRRIVGIDYGLRAPYAAVWTAIDYDGNPWTYRVDYQAGLTADVQAERVRDKTLPGERIDAVYLDPAMFNKNPGHDGPTDKCTADDYAAILCADDRFPDGLIRGYNKNRIHALSTLDKLLRHGNGFPDWRIEQSCTPLWTELTGAVFKQGIGFREYSEDIDERNPDHAITASYYHLHTHYQLPDRAPEPLDPAKAVQLMMMDRERQALREFERAAKRNFQI